MSKRKRRQAALKGWETRRQNAARRLAPLIMREALAQLENRVVLNEAAVRREYQRVRGNG